MPTKRRDDDLRPWQFSPPEPLDAVIDEAQTHLSETRAGEPPHPKFRLRDTSLGSALRYGLNQITDNVGLSLGYAGHPRLAQFMTDMVDEPPPFYVTSDEDFANANGEGYNWSALGRSLVEQAPNLAVSAGAKMVPVVGPALAYEHGYLQAYGAILKAREKANGGVITEADKEFAHKAAMASGAIDAVGFGGLAKPAAALGRTAAGAAATASASLAEKAAQTAAGKTIVEAAEAVTRSVPVDKFVATVARPAAEAIENIARTKPATALREAVVSAPIRELAKDALIGGLESGTKSIVEQTGGSVATPAGLTINPATVIREAATGAGLEVGKGLARSGTRAAWQNLTPEHRELLGGAAATMAASKAMEKLRHSESGAAEPSDDPAGEMARRALLVQSGQDALSGTAPADETTDPQRQLDDLTSAWDDLAPADQLARLDALYDQLPADIRRQVDALRQQSAQDRPLHITVSPQSAGQP